MYACMHTYIHTFKDTSRENVKGKSIWKHKWRGMRGNTVLEKQ